MARGRAVAAFRFFFSLELHICRTMKVCGLVEGEVVVLAVVLVVAVDVAVLLVLIADRLSVLLFVCSYSVSTAPPSSQILYGLLK